MAPGDPIPQQQRLILAITQEPAAIWQGNPPAIGRIGQGTSLSQRRLGQNIPFFSVYGGQPDGFFLIHEGQEFTSRSKVRKRGFSPRKRPLKRIEIRKAFPTRSFHPFASLFTGTRELLDRVFLLNPGKAEVEGQQVLYLFSFHEQIRLSLPERGRAMKDPIHTPENIWYFLLERSKDQADSPLTGVSGATQKRALL